MDIEHHVASRRRSAVVVAGMAALTLAATQGLIWAAFAALNRAGHRAGGTTASDNAETVTSALSTFWSSPAWWAGVASFGLVLAARLSLGRYTTLRVSLWTIALASGGYLLPSVVMAPVLLVYSLFAYGNAWVAIAVASLATAQMRRTHGRGAGSQPVRRTANAS